MVRSMTFVTLLWTLSLVGAPSVDALLLDIETRDRYEARWSHGMVTVVYRPPASPLEDQDMTPPMEVRGFLMEGSEGTPAWVAAPSRRLEGLSRAEVHLPSGQVLGATIEWPQDGRDAPLVRLRLHGAAPDLRGLQWAPEERVLKGRRAWVIERPKGRGPTGERMDPVLVDTSIGAAVEPPLQRFWSARLREADGTPLLDVDGSVLCAIFRPSPVDPAVAYCATREWAFAVPKRETE